MSGPAGGRPADGRPADLRLARAHLRLGLHALARAELETRAARGELDTAAFAELAEARWRTGDLAGAGVAARAHLDAGGHDATTLVIAAEAAMSDGRVADARSFAEAARAAGGDLDAIFAGQRRSRVWRQKTADGSAPLAEEGVAAGAEPGGPAAPEEMRGRPVLGLPSAASRASMDARDLIAFAASALHGDPGRAATELAIVLRREPSLAPAVLELLARAGEANASRSAAALEVVRGDAHRLIGRTREAEEAYSRAATVLGKLEGVGG